MEAPGREHIVELILGGGRRLSPCVVGGNVARVGRQPLWPVSRSPATGILGPHKLQAECLHPVKDGALSEGERLRATSSVPRTMLRSPAATTRWVPGLVWPMKAERSEMMRWAEASECPTPQLLRVDGWGLSHRAYIDTMMNGSACGSPGVTRAAAIVPMPLTAISSAATSLIGEPCLNHSTPTRSDSWTTIGHRS